ncbi:hypothetical protein WCLP8_4650006 [uncultured Gammaproteobacteria bacterium]
MKGMGFSIPHQSSRVALFSLNNYRLSKKDEIATQRDCCARFAMNFRLLLGTIKPGSF